MASVTFFSGSKRYSPGYLAMVRIALGLWLTWNFVGFAGSAEASVSAAGRGTLFGFLPLPSTWLHVPWVLPAWCALGTAAGTLLALGWRRAWAGFAVWFLWAGLGGRDGIIAYPLDPYAGWAALLIAVVPDGEPWRWRGKSVAPRDWKMPTGVWLGAWGLLAASYAGDGLGRAVAVLAGEADVPGGAGAAWWWGVAMVEIAFAPLCLTRRGRVWGWCTMLAAGLFLPLAAGMPGASAGLLFLHAFTFDPDWLPARAEADRKPVLFYDGECGLCNAVVRFLLREDPGAVLRFAALQSPLGQNELRRAGLPLTDFDSLLFTPDLRGHRRFLRTRGVIAVLDMLGGIWRVIAWVSWLVPGPLRDAVYKLVARTRYALFGVYAPRPLENPCWAERFLVD